MCDEARRLIELYGSKWSPLPQQSRLHLFILSSSSLFLLSSLSLCVFFFFCACPSRVVCVVEGEWCRGGAELEAFSTSKHLGVDPCVFVRACMRQAWARQAEHSTVKTCTYFSCWKLGGRQARKPRRGKESRQDAISGDDLWKCEGKVRKVAVRSDAPPFATAYFYRRG